MTILRVLQQVEFMYPDNEQYVYCLPADISIASGKTYSIHGISGSGKSTILTLLAALRRFHRGELRYTFAENVVFHVKPETWKTVVGPHFWGKMGFSFQRPELLRALTVKANLELALGEANAEGMALALFATCEALDIDIRQLLVSMERMKNDLNGPFTSTS